MPSWQSFSSASALERKRGKACRWLEHWRPISLVAVFSNCTISACGTQGGCGFRRYRTGSSDSAPTVGQGSCSAPCVAWRSSRCCWSSSRWMRRRPSATSATHTPQRSWRHAGPHQQVAALLREAIGARVLPRIGAIEGPWQLLEKGFRQMDARRSEVWNHAIFGLSAAARDRIECILRPAVPWSAELPR